MCSSVEKAAAHWNEKPDPIAIKPFKLWGNARIIKDMAEGRRVFTDAIYSRPSGCENLGKHGFCKKTCGEPGTGWSRMS